MIILPDKNIPRARFLMPVYDHDWRVPSQAQPKDMFGNENRTRFRIRAKTHDGVVLWTGWFDDRADCDAFLWAIAIGQLQTERPLWDLPTPMWPGLDPGLVYEFATVTYYTSGTTATYTSPVDWNNSDNSIECIGGGGSGAAGGGATNRALSGAGAGAYSKITNFSFATPGTTTASYTVGASVAGVNNNGGSNSASGTDGNPTFFNSTTNPGNGTDNTKCSAAAGAKGIHQQVSTGVAGGAGGATTASWGQTKYAGGNGGAIASGSMATTAAGGGGAAGPNGAGAAGATAAINSASNGGQGGNGSGGSGGSGTTTSPGGAGGNGTEFDSTHGSGGGGGSCRVTTNNPVGGAGGNYGAGGGACGSTTGSNITSGAGASGLLVITYTPATAVNGFGNMPMLGM